MGGLLPDLTKALDCVNNDVLLAKFEFYGINNKAGKSNFSSSFIKYQGISPGY
jgi:hypothetical protein